MNTYETNPCSNKTIISLSDILLLGKDRLDKFHLDFKYIQVKVLWRSGHQKDSRACNLIFADSSGHIPAIVFFEENDINSRNVREKLRPDSNWRIINFEVFTTKDEGIDKNLFRHLNKGLKLSQNTGDIVEIPSYEGVDDTAFITYIPFEFTPFERIDGVPDGKWIDLIGFVETQENKTDENGNKYKTVIVRPFKCDQGIKKEIKLVGEAQINAVTRKNAVYAFLNIEVSTLFRQKSLKTCCKTAIFEIKSQQVERMLPPMYHGGEFDRQLFPRRKSSSRKNIRPSPEDLLLAEFIPELLIKY